jgi:hypothetical protein
MTDVPSGSNSALKNGQYRNREPATEMIYTLTFGIGMAQEMAIDLARRSREDIASEISS